MNKNVFRPVHRAAPAALLVALLLLALAAPGRPTAAQGDTPTAEATETVEPTATAPSAALTVTAVQPGNVVNDLDVEIVVTGTGFARGATVVLARFGGLATDFVSDNVLRATVPAGVPGGRYTVRVVNPDATTAELPDALNVTAVGPGTATPVETATPAPTAFVRPLLVVQSYGASSATITPNQNLDFEMTLVNAGQATASNVLVTFISGDFIPRDTGGVRALGTMPPGQPVRFWQPLFATADLSGKTTAVLKVTASYTDVNGQSYENAFELTFPVTPSGGGGAGPSPTPTATATVTPTVTPRPRPQLLVTSNSTDPEQLQPGGRFTLNLVVENRGQADARNITMILGGGTSSSGGDGTPEPGGVAGGGGSFGEFAPVGSSNVSTLGNLAVGESTEASQQLIVNTTTKAGAYPVKVSFVYSDNTGANYVDDQVVTLLVYEVPQVEMGFYAPPPTLFAGEPGSLPLQVVNTGRTSAIFGNFSATAEGADMSNNTIFVGALEPGGFFPLDALITAYEPGLLDVSLSLNYVDDFNQPAVITDTVQVEVLEAIPMEPVDPGLEGGGGEGIDGETPPDETGAGSEESLGQRIWRFILGLLGLSSAPPGDQPAEEMPPPVEGEFEVVP
jgi:uncharacterized repeat protein (TIGR01451 family)